MPNSLFVECQNDLPSNDIMPFIMILFRFDRTSEPKFKYVLSVSFGAVFVGAGAAVVAVAIVYVCLNVFEHQSH